MKKKFLAFILAALMAFSLVLPASASSDEVADVEAESETEEVVVDDSDEEIVESEAELGGQNEAAEELGSTDTQSETETAGTDAEVSDDAPAAEDTDAVGTEENSATADEGADDEALSSDYTADTADSAVEGDVDADEDEPFDPDTVEFGPENDPDDPLYVKLQSSQSNQPSTASLSSSAYDSFTTRDLEGNEVLHKGIDVSAFQGDIDWDEVAADGVEFAIVRVAYRGWGSAGNLRLDSYYQQNIEGALAAGLKVGVYIYSQATTEAEAVEEAQLLISKIGDYDIELPVVIDFEYAGSYGRLYDANLTQQEGTDICLAFCQEVENAGYESMVYANYSMLQNHLYADELTRVWMANYTTKTTYPGNYEYWQCSSSGSISGISGSVDLDFWFDPFGELSSLEDVTVNPLYEEDLTEADIIEAIGSIDTSDDDGLATASVYNDIEYFSDAADLAPTVKEAMLSRTESVTLYMEVDTYSQDSINELLSDIFEIVFEHTGVPTEGDYLKWQYSGWAWSTKGTKSGDAYYVTMTLNITYYTTAAQEAEMDTAVAALIESLGLNDMGSDYEKVKAIYDYICQNITYDYTNLEDSSCTLKYTAYAGLVNKTCICQGYATLFYRLALECGIDNRVIYGHTSTGVAHTWNIVKLGDYYYNIDLTWDEQLTEAGKSYSFFLRGSDNFSGHTRDEEYDPAATSNEYVMSASDYDSDANAEHTCTYYYYDPDAHTATCETCGTVVEDVYMRGDVNGDGEVGSRDVSYLAIYINGTSSSVSEFIESTQENFDACDITGDGEIGSRDLSYLAKYVSGNLTTELGIGKLIFPDT